MKSNRKTNLLRGVAAALVLAGAGFAHASGHGDYVDLRTTGPITGDGSAGATKAVLCQACHGPNGNAVVPAFPRLAGQSADYIYHRLVEFADAHAKGLDNTDFYKQSVMAQQAPLLSDEDRRNVAVYFSSQDPKPGAVPAAGHLVQEGEGLYQHGDPARGIPPCAGCHGADANGPVHRDHQYASWPKLRGQHEAFVAMRLHYFRYGTPNASSNDFIMQGVARTLDDDAINAIAAYVNSLTPGAAH